MTLYNKIKKWIQTRTVNKPYNLEQSQKNNVTIVIVGTIITCFMLTSLLIYSYLTSQNVQLLPRIAIAFAIFIYALMILFLIKKSHRLAAVMTVLLYLLIACYILSNWSINSPIGILLLGFIIFLATITLGSKSSLYVGIIISICLLIIQLLTSAQIITPDTSTFDQQSTMSDAVSYIIIFCIFGLTAWVSSKFTEVSFKRALQAEKEVANEKKLLSIKLEEQARQLNSAKLEEIYQLYQFAELGQLTSSMFHELANHLSILGLDIQAVPDKKLSKQLDESLAEIDTMVSNVRRRIAAENSSEKFKIHECIESTCKEVERIQKIKQLKLSVGYNVSNSLKNKTVYGDSLRLSQAVAILLNNAVYALKESQNHHRNIKVELNQSDEEYLIIITDNGPGISKLQQRKLFTPQKSTKEKGLGIGLFIAYQFIETHFNGYIQYDSKYKNGARFIIHLPKN